MLYFPQIINLVFVLKVGSNIYNNWNVFYPNILKIDRRDKKIVCTH